MNLFIMVGGCLSLTDFQSSTPQGWTGFVCDEHAGLGWDSCVWDDWVTLD